MIKGTENLPVGDLISRRVPFRIPIYQRAYAWERDEIEDFINDLLSLYQARKKNAKMKHFFGGIVSVERFAGNTYTGRTFEVVDGQQRLATFMLTLGLIARNMEDLGELARNDDDIETRDNAIAHTAQTKRDFLEYDEVQDGKLQQQLRLKLSKVDDVFFDQLIRARTTPTPSRTIRSHKRLRYAFNKINRELLQHILGEIDTISDKLNCLVELRTCIVNDCHVIHIVSDDRSEAYRLFRVLNDRGKNLGTGDLLRSDTLELLEEYKQLQEQAEKNWDTILSKSTERETDQFLTSYYISFSGKGSTKRDLFDNFRDYFFPYEFTELPLYREQAVKVENHINNMTLESRIFPNILVCNWPYEDSKVSTWHRDRLFRLVKILGHKLCFPLLLSAVSCLDEKIFSDLVCLLEKFSFRYINIVGAHPERAKAKYYKYAKSIRNHPQNFNLDTLRNELKKIIDKHASDPVFISNLEAKLSYSKSSKQRQLIKHFLTTLEDHHIWLINGGNGKPKPDTSKAFDLSQIHIEHVYPQNAKIKVDKMEPLKHNIGNLSFWGPGEDKAGNNPFELKKKFYKRSNVRMTKKLAELNIWDEKTIMERRDQLIQDALKIFSLRK